VSYSFSGFQKRKLNGGTAEDWDANDTSKISSVADNHEMFLQEEKYLCGIRFATAL
jgi:hypothetical protein